MTLASLPVPLRYPRGLCEPTTSTIIMGNGGILDAAGEYMAFFIQAPFDMAISHVNALHAFNLVGSPTADYRIETVDASGNPSGTLWATSTEKAGFTVAAGMNIQQLDAVASVSRGDEFFLMVRLAGGTSFQSTNIQGIGTNSENGRPYRVTNTTGSPLKSTGINYPILLGSNANTFYCIPNYLPVSGMGTINFNNTNGQMQGNRIKLPFKARCHGISFVGAASGSLGDYNAVLQDDSNNDLASKAVDGDSSNPSSVQRQEVIFDSPVTLEKDTWYRYGKEPTSATNTQLSQFNVSHTDHRAAMPSGADCYRSTRTSGTWTDDTDSIVMADLLLEPDDGAGSGSGGVTKAAMNAGVGLC